MSYRNFNRAFVYVDKKKECIHENNRSNFTHTYIYMYTIYET